MRSLCLSHVVIWKMIDTCQPIRIEYSLWPRYKSRLFCSLWNNLAFFFSEALHCLCIESLLMACNIFSNLNDSGMVREGISVEVTVFSQPYRQPHWDLSPDFSHITLRNRFVFRSSNSTLFDINTTDIAYKLIWQYLIKIDYVIPWSVLLLQTNLQWKPAVMVTAKSRSFLMRGI